MNSDIETHDRPVGEKGSRYVTYLLLGVTGVIGIGILDYQTGWQMSFSVFYLAPILVVTWSWSRTAGPKSGSIPSGQRR